MSRLLVHRPGFTEDLLSNDAGEVKQVLNKCRVLETDPEPDAKSRKRLDGRNDGLHRLRSGDYRLFYTFDDRTVSLWALRRKKVQGQYRGKKGGDRTYDGLDEIDDELDDLELDLPGGGGSGPSSEDFERWLADRRDVTPLPEPITVEILSRLRIPEELHPRLLLIEDQESLLECPGVPEDNLLALDQYLFDGPIGDRGTQPELVAPGGIDDLLRYTDGELVPFLLKLDPDQQKFVTWASNSSGPTLVKGGPGTGKSTVAIYRAQEMLRVLRADGVEHPRILFTTYTNALVTFSQQLLASVLGGEAGAVDVRTVDSLVTEILRDGSANLPRPDAAKRSAIQKQAFAEPLLQGNALQHAAQRSSLDRLGHSYVFEEIHTVIQARDLRTVDDYLAAGRPGRRVPLGDTQRRAVWAVHRAYEDLLATSGLQTWQQARARAAALISAGPVFRDRYDAVIIDEAQDLDASAIRLLVDLCAGPGRLFLTADESQSIHSSGFSWTDVHEHLRFRGRTGILRANHRSTEQIVEAARDYLAAGLTGELAPDTQTYVHTGALPAHRSVDQAAEVDLIARFLRGATRDLRVTIGSGAVIVPDRFAGEPIATALRSQGIPATYRDSRHFELDDNSVTVLPLMAAKGLEFPVVTLGGFGRSNWPHLDDGLDDDTLLDELTRHRRTLFVAMTRAMRALLVLTPADVTPTAHHSMLFDGFDHKLWNTDSP